MPSTPAATTPNRVSSPSETLKPANSMIASLGTGMQADSSVISTKTADDAGRADEFGGDVDDRFDDHVGDAGEEEERASERHIVGKIGP